MKWNDDLKKSARDPVKWVNWEHRTRVGIVWVLGALSLFSIVMVSATMGGCPWVL